MSIIVFDTETTGLSPRQGHRIIEIGAVKIVDGAIIDEFHSLINAGRSIPHHAQAVHGISRSMLHDQPHPEEIFPQFYEFIDSATIVAHNAPFDIRFLTAEFERLELLIPNKVECTLRFSRSKLPRLKNYKLETVYKYLGGAVDENMQRHRALDDAKMAAFVWLYLQGK